MHPRESDLALYSGGDLGWPAAWKVKLHLRRCAACRAMLAQFCALRGELAASHEIPEADWSRLAAEMQANIRLGLAAGACVTPRPDATPAAWQNLLAYAGALALVVAAVWLQRPAPPAPNAQVFAATAQGIEFHQGGRVLGLLHPRNRDVTVSVGAQGSVGARYVDADTGQVVIQNVVSVQ